MGSAVTDGCSAAVYEVLPPMNAGSQSTHPSFPSFTLQPLPPPFIPSSHPPFPDPDFALFIFVIWPPPAAAAQTVRTCKLVASRNSSIEASVVCRGCRYKCSVGIGVCVDIGRGVGIVSWIV
eukprot:GHVU01188160.1.p1 GENE.GHVU01188160.1~~GHVU01188160.1.p1  ORF type:complete len:122 (+),score=11.77 GHVU01188160.1:467-832(+)